MSNEQKCYEYFKKNMGLNTAGACGILANIKYESGFRPNVYGDGGTSYGICQWHNTRFTNLKNYCSKNNYDYKSIEGQLHFLQYELEHNYKSLINYIKKVPNTSTGSYDAGYKFCYNFERPANKSVKSVTRGNYAKSYFNKYNVNVKPTPSTGDEVYIVKKGDTLSGIARKYNTTYQELAKYNNISNPNLIIVGQKIKIPKKNSTPSNDKKEVIYVVKKGDTLTAIAKKYNTTINKIAKDNNIKNKNLILVGQKLVIK